MPVIVPAWVSCTRSPTAESVGPWAVATRCSAPSPPPPILAGCRSSPARISFAPERLALDELQAIGRCHMLERPALVVTQAPASRPMPIRAGDELARAVLRRARRLSGPWCRSGRSGAPAAGVGVRSCRPVGRCRPRLHPRRQRPAHGHRRARSAGDTHLHARPRQQPRRPARPQGARTLLPGPGQARRRCGHRGRAQERWRTVVHTLRRGQGRCGGRHGSGRRRHRGAAGARASAALRATELHPKSGRGYEGLTREQSSPDSRGSAGRSLGAARAPRSPG